MDGYSQENLSEVSGRIYVMLKSPQLVYLRSPVLSHLFHKKCWFRPLQRSGRPGMIADWAGRNLVCWMSQAVNFIMCRDFRPPPPYFKFIPAFVSYPPFLLSAVNPDYVVLFSMRHHPQLSPLGVFLVKKGAALFTDTFPYQERKF